MSGLPFCLARRWFCPVAGVRRLSRHGERKRSRSSAWHRRIGVRMSVRTKGTASRMGSVVAITNQKGGVGKTTTAVNLAAALAVAEQRVLLIDIDPQGNATSGVGHSPKTVQLGIYDVLVGRSSAKEASRATDIGYLKIVPSSA